MDWLFLVAVVGEKEILLPIIFVFFLFSFEIFKREEIPKNLFRMCLFFP